MFKNENIKIALFTILQVCIVGLGVWLSGKIYANKANINSHTIQLEVLDTKIETVDKKVSSVLKFRTNMVKELREIHKHLDTILEKLNKNGQ